MVDGSEGWRETASTLEVMRIVWRLLSRNAQDIRISVVFDTTAKGKRK